MSNNWKLDLSGNLSVAGNIIGDGSQITGVTTAHVVGLDASLATKATHVEVARLDNQKLLFPSKEVYADGTQMALPPSVMANKGVKGWYFKNGNQNSKINWYMPTVGMKVSDITGLYLDMFNGSNINTFNMPFITVYTAKDDLTANASSWYKSKKGYTVCLPDTTVVSSNTHYTPFMNVSGSCAQPVLKQGSVIATMIQNESVLVSKGLFAPDETVFLISVGSASTALQNEVEFCISKFGIITDITQELVFVVDGNIALDAQIAALMARIVVLEARP